jgi:hypothetical protein
MGRFVRYHPVSVAVNLLRKTADDIIKNRFIGYILEQKKYVDEDK